jgi:hypothetical protein
MGFATMINMNRLRELTAELGFTSPPPPMRPPSTVGSDNLTPR